MIQHALEKEGSSDNSLNEFIRISDQHYTGSLATIKLFDPNWTASWSDNCRQKFVKTFYHLRGNFHHFLWILGNFAPDSARKDMVLANIREEFSGDWPSHEQLYIEFAKALGVDMLEEMTNPQHEFDFVRAFNRQHQTWLLERDWPSKQAAFSAYERLDNLDYPLLLKLAESFNLPESALLFFKIHAKVTHYDVTEKHLEVIWLNNPKAVEQGFNFIYQHQLQMWRQLSLLMEEFSDGASP